jgi:hypothetical protein
LLFAHSSDDLNQPFVVGIGLFQKIKSADPHCRVGYRSQLHFFKKSAGKCWFLDLAVQGLNPAKREVGCAAGYMVFEPTLLGALSVPSAASAATEKYQVPLLRPVIS